jgi:EAL domain-containing protein (putative c-di-GMP-specific phosphodiesterase class I)
MKNADQAMYVAKKNGRNRFSYFTPALQEQAKNRQLLIRDLRNALAENQLKVYFQPIVELSTGKVHKAEALLRWIHPERGMISPVEFIPLAEETRLILEIGAWVRMQSAIWCKRWNEICTDKFQISINRSPVEFMDDSKIASVTTFIAYLREHGLTGENFVFEITEGMLLNLSSNVSNELMVLRNEGIQVSLDDFGTGYSSLSYLNKLDIDYLKIDKSFVCDITPESDNLVLCEAIISMSHKLGLKVIAEGVETEQQRDLLVKAHCDFAQGYFYSRPVPPEELEIWMKNNNNHRLIKA